METEVMWLNMLRMVQFAVRFGVFACIMAIPLEESGGMRIREDLSRYR